MYTNKLGICEQCRGNGGFPMTEMGRQLAVKARSCKSLPPPSWQKNYEYWRKAFLPCWVRRIGYSSRTKWAKLIGGLGGLPASHLGKSRLKFFQMRNEAFKIAAGGCSGGVWADMPTGPTRTSVEYGTAIKVPALLGGNRGWNPN